MINIFSLVFSTSFLLFIIFRAARLNSESTSADEFQNRPAARLQENAIKTPVSLETLSDALKKDGKDRL